MALEKEDFPNIERFNPRSCISGKMRKCNRLVAQIFRKKIAPFGLTNSQLSILFIASKKPSITQSFLSEKLILEKSTVSRNMRRLFEKEYLVKKETQQINITQKGKLLVEQIIPEWEKAMTEIRSKLEAEGEEALGLLFQRLMI